MRVFRGWRNSGPRFGRFDASEMAMIHSIRPNVACRRLLAAALVVLATGISAAAQNVVVIVNGEPITALDVEQRGKLIQLTSQKTAPRQDVINELIDEKLKVREGKRWGIEVSDSEV